MIKRKLSQRSTAVQLLIGRVRPDYCQSLPSAVYVCLPLLAGGGITHLLKHIFWGVGNLKKIVCSLKTLYIFKVSIGYIL